MNDIILARLREIVEERGLRETARAMRIFHATLSLILRGKVSGDPRQGACARVT